MSQSPPQPFRLRCLGAFELSAPDGRPVVLGKKAQGVLAVLAHRAGRPVTRARLQDLLWSLSGPEHGRDSLKKALRQIRAALGPDADRVLVAGPGDLRLRPEAIRTDLGGGGAGGAFLEGLDVGDPEFESWLREVRQARGRAVGAGGGTDARPPGRLRLAIEPVRALQGDAAAAAAAEILLGRLLLALRHDDLLDIRDLRGADRQSLGGAEAALSCVAVRAGDEVQVELSVRDARSAAIVWNAQMGLETARLRAPAMHETIAQLADQLHRGLAGRARDVSEEERCVTRLAMRGIERLFRLGTENLDAAEAAFARAYEIEPRGVLLAWSAFVSAFRYEADKGARAAALRERSEGAMARALEADPHNPLARALLAHVCSFVHRDFARADALLAPLAGLRPDLPLYHFADSMLRFYQGDLSRARTAAAKARRHGACHPYAYAFATSECMIDLAAGRAQSAVGHGRAALALMPHGPRPYEPTLRYLTAAHARAGDLDAARGVWDRLVRFDPANTPEALRARDFPVPSEHARAALAAGLSAAASAPLT